jgi:hypothetical protein
MKKSRVRSIGKEKAFQLINNSKGRVFTVSFLKNNGQPRTINGVRAAIQLHNNLGYITVYDMKEKGFKQVAASRITGLKTNHISYKVK